ncbi:alpha-galactosidase [Mucilaginibacter psychrotolerans]|uniref:Alpha-galactosidase n=2 Tax=Mucilaginibacter psychrotolerans TaxID=1524096 RepID=A0A4Y8SH05_9SPHI|nr:alpha-galactosidase [Mucilaginibacter psychrotolerans]
MTVAVNSTASALRPPAKMVRAVNSTVRINYGADGHIIYDTGKGICTVYQGKETVFTGVSSSVKIKGKLISSKDYKISAYAKTSVSNGFGKGFKHTFTLSGNGLPQMQQVFYTYPKKSYFFTETIISGTGISTSHIVPFEGGLRNIPGESRTLFIPFDNDTFISYDAKPFKAPVASVSAEAGVVYDNDSRGGVIAGSLEHMNWKTGVFTNASADGNTIKVLAGYTEESVTRDKLPHGEISGKSVKSPLIFIGYFSDWRIGMDAYARDNRIAEPPFVFNWKKSTPVGWNSWGVIQDKLNYEKAVKVADFFADSLKGFRAGNTAYVDLDSYWDNMIKGGLEGDFSQLKAFADHCKAKGLKPGVYWAPFTDWGFKGGADRKVDGSDYKFGEIWTKIGNEYHELDGARALDPTHPGTQQRIAYVIKKLKDCGFKMIKIDFLGHAAVESNHFYDKKITTGMQAYRRGMEYLVSQLGDQMLIYAAISPSLASGRYVHSRRVACDAFKSIKDTQYTLNSVSYGWWQTYLYNYIDADHVVLENESEGQNRARMLSAIVTGTFITGDDFSKTGQWTARAKEWYQNKELLKVIFNGKAFEPVDGNTGTGASAMFTKKAGNDFYLAVFNYKSDTSSFTIDANRIGLTADKTYVMSELIEDNQITLTGKTTIELPYADAKIYKIKLAPVGH